jgi:hypothetical protein
MRDRDHFGRPSRQKRAHPFGVFCRPIARGALRELIEGPAAFSIHGVFAFEKSRPRRRGSSQVRMARQSGTAKQYGNRAA